MSDNKTCVTELDTSSRLHTRVKLSVEVYVGCSYGHCPLPSTIQHPSYDDCLEVKREHYQNCSVLDCVTQFSTSELHLYDQFFQVQQIRFATVGLVIIWPVKIVPKVSYNVLSGTLSLYTTTALWSVYFSSC